MAYLLNNLNDIQEVYTPNIQYLKDEYMRTLTCFPKTEEAIINSMRFFQYHYYGDEYEKEHLSFQEFDFKNKSHKYYGINYEYLIKNIDLDVFSTELEKKVSFDENKFIEKIDSNLETMNTILFERNLKNDVSSLLNSISNLSKLSETSNNIDKIVIEKYLSSYNKTYSSLKKEYRPSVNNKEIFKSSNQFDLNKPHDFNTWDVIKAFNPNPPSIGGYSDFMIQHLTDKIEFDRFKRNKDKTVLNPHPEIFKSGETFDYFIEYNNKHIVDGLTDYSYLFQRMLIENLIHRMKHFEFIDWMKNNNLIKLKDYNLIFEKGGFKSLNKSTSANRENNFNIIFKM